MVAIIRDRETEGRRNKKKTIREERKEKYKREREREKEWLIRELQHNGMKFNNKDKKREKERKEHKNKLQKSLNKKFN